MDAGAQLDRRRNGGCAEWRARRRGGRVDGGGGRRGRGGARHHLLAHLPDLELQAHLGREGVGVLCLERRRRLREWLSRPSVGTFCSDTG